MAKRLDKRDFDRAAKYIFDELERRKKDRHDREKIWEEVDRQIALQAKKVDRPGTDWFPETEPAEQATALEVLTADARRLMFPEGDKWFTVHAKADDQLLERLSREPLISGDSEGVPANVDQDDVDAIVAAVVAHNLRKYDFKAVMDELNAEAFRYGNWTARLVLGKRDVITDNQRGRAKNEERFPALVAQSMWNTYLDDSPQQLLNEGFVVQPSTIRCIQQNVKDLKKAAEKGSTDPTKPNGGWLKKQVKDLEAMKGKQGFVEVAEFEGDLLIERSTETVFLPNCICTAAMGSEGAVLIRYRENPFPFRQTINQPYHAERAGDPYAAGPLMKGVPVQTGMAEALNRLLQSMVLATEPPGNYDPGDYYMIAQGGPIIEPRRMQAALSEPNFWDIGDVESLSEAYLLFLKQYEELVGVHAPRTGAQTKSHQTAFAIDQEITRSQIRTVDYVKTTLEGGLTDFLYRLYEILKKEMPVEDVFVPDYGYIKIGKQHLPDEVVFRAHGASGPLQEQEERAQKLQAIQGIVQMEPLARQAGGKPIDIDKIRQEILRDAGIQSPERYFGESTSPGGGGAQARPEFPGLSDLT